jgi:hypothetical protein
VAFDLPRELAQEARLYAARLPEMIGTAQVMAGQWTGLAVLMLTAFPLSNQQNIQQNIQPTGAYVFWREKAEDL